MTLRDDLAGPLAALLAAVDPAREGPPVPAALAPAVPAVAAELLAHPPLHRAAEVALTQFQQVTQALPAYQRALAAARGMPADQVGAALQAHDLGKLKGVMLPLTNLHATFKGYPATGALFPAPDVVRLRGEVPAKERDVAPLPVETAPEPEAPPVPEPEKRKFADWRAEADDLSRRRLSLLTGFMQDPDDRSVLRDNATVYRLVTDELAYQREREMDRRMQLRLIQNGAGPDDRRASLEAELADARRMLVQLAQLTKYVAAKGAQ
ncbi:MAG: hypothetical protein JWM80_3476 [Cyanobacteria bacterium RYN_339]|nr:hypothetical protein [Cyanobacteria bacterium RYN_339]